MAIEKIDAELCTGCGICAKICPKDCIRMNEHGIAYLAYPEDCALCVFCEMDCPVGAIYVSPDLRPPALTSWGV